MKMMMRNPQHLSAGYDGFWRRVSSTSGSWIICRVIGCHGRPSPHRAQLLPSPGALASPFAQMALPIVSSHGRSPCTVPLARRERSTVPHRKTQSSRWTMYGPYPVRIRTTVRSRTHRPRVNLPQYYCAWTFAPTCSCHKIVKILLIKKEPPSHNQR